MGDEERSILHGVVFYSCLYVNGILLAITLLTGRMTFMLLIVLTMGLTAYMLYVASHNKEHLRKVGQWAEKMFASHVELLRRIF